MGTFSRRATIDWVGDVLHGSGDVTAGTSAFAVPVTHRGIAGEPATMISPKGSRTMEGCTTSAAIRSVLAIAVDVDAV
jgi:hypothetical protein